MSRAPATSFSRHRLTWLAVYVAMSAAFCWPVFADPLAHGTGDWDQHLFYYASVLRNAAHGQLPFWNPWYCGGNVLWQNPQVSLISPVYLAAVTMPLALAMKLNILGHYIVGCLGMHLVIRRMIGVRSPFVVVYLVGLFVFSGAIALHLEVGHSDFLSMFWLPLLIYCFWRSVAGSRRHFVGAAAIVAVAILNGGPHVVPLAAIVLGGFGIGGLVFGRTARPLLLAMALVVMGCAFAAPRLLPSWLLLQSPSFHDTRPVKHPDYMSLEMLRVALFDATQGTPTRLNRTVQLYGWQEYGNYLGWTGAALAFASAAWILLVRWRRRHWREASAALTLVAIVLLTAGEFAAWSPASLLHELPFFSSFRIPSRHILLVPLVGAMCIAYAARAFERTRAPGSARRMVDVLCVIAVVQVGLVNREHFREVFILPASADDARLFERVPPVNAERDVPRIGAPPRVLYTNMLGSMMAGVSPLDCWEPLQLRKRAQPGPVVIGAGEGPVTIGNQQFSPNRMSADVSVGGAPARVFLNQNFSEWWTTEAGVVERDPDSGLPSVALPAGYTGRVAFRFTPPGLLAGLLIFGLTVGVSALIWRRRESDRAPEAS